MKIRSLEFLNRSEIQRLRDVADMEVSEYIAWIDEKQSQNMTINKPYINLYEKIKKNMPVVIAAQKAIPAIQPAKDSKQILLEQVPIQELEYYFPMERYYIGRLKSGGIHCLGDFYMTSIAVIERIPLVGTTAIGRIQNMKDYVGQNAQRIVDVWRDSQVIHELPSNYNRNLGISRNLRNAFLEFAQIIEKNIKNRRYMTSSQEIKTFSLLSEILKGYYDEKKSDQRIAEEKGYTYERVRQMRHRCVSEAICGKVFFTNYKLNPSLLDLLDSLKEECLYAPLSKFITFSGSSDTDLLDDLECDITEIKDTTFLIPFGTKRIYSQVGKIIIKTLVENPLPTDKNVLYELVIHHEELLGIDYDTTFVENVLACDEIVDIKDDNLIQIKNQYLTHAAQKYARIIYEAGEKITTEEVKKRYKDIYDNVDPTTGVNTAGKYGISCEGRKYWYYGEPKMPMQQRVTEFAEERIIFNYVDIEQEIKNDGYTIPLAFRVYITNVCAVDNKDTNHFCHKDYVDDYPEYSWRSPSKYGQINWVLNETKVILKEKESVSIGDLVAEIEKRSQSTEYKDAIKWSKYIVANYCGDGKPFKINEEIISINEEVFDTTDFETIGLRGEKYAYYKQIRAIAANEAKKDESGKKSLMDIVNLVNEITDEPLSRNTILRAIKDEHHRFAPIDIEIVKEDGVLYVQWTKKDIVPEPVYVVKSADEISDKEEIYEVKEAEQRPGIKYRQKIDWKELNLAMKRELVFYGRWMEYDKINIDSAIDGFTQFLSMAQNTNLSQRLPMDLYEYWFASTDCFDRSRYLNDLLIFFEAALKEIFIQQEGKELPHTKGLVEIAQRFHGLPDMFLYSKDSKGFHRIASDLYFKRNKVAHGESLNLSSWETAKLITDFIALYVYIVFKYRYQLETKD